MIRVAICDDNEYFCTKLEKYILKYEKDKKVKIKVEPFLKGEELLKQMEEVRFDLIFLDIELGTTTGILVGHKIRKEFKDNISKIVFVTSKTGYEEQLFDVQPFNFMKKPVDEEKVHDILKLAMEILEVDNEIFTYKKMREFVKIAMKDILYFEKDGRKIKIVTNNKEEHFNSSLDKIKENIPTYFVIPHSSFIVNYKSIKRIKADTIEMVNGDIIPMSQRNGKEIKRMLKDKGSRK